jgi:hypothetical protein
MNRYKCNLQIILVQKGINIQISTNIINNVIILFEFKYIYAQIIKWIIFMQNGKLIKIQRVKQKVNLIVL